MLQDFLQRLLGGGAPVQPMPNRLGLAPDMLEGPGAAGPGMLAYHNALSSMSAPAQQAQPFTLDAQGFPSAPAPYAAQQAQPAPMQSQQPLSRSGVSEAPSGGGIGSFLGNIFNPGAAGRNQTVQWLQTQGMDEGTATLMAGNKNALQSYLLDRTKGADPKAALELAKLQLDIQDRLNPKRETVTINGRLVDAQTGEEIANFGQERQLINAGDGRLYDQQTGEWVIAPDSGQADLPAGVREYEYARDQGFPGTYQDWEASKKGGMSLQVDPETGAVTFQQGGNIKPLTEGQSKDAVYATRAEGSLPMIDQYGEALARFDESMGARVPFVGNYMKTEEYQQAEQAGQEFLQAILRKDTGAAITKEEVAEYGSVYLPRPGDGPAVLEQKRLSRQRALNAIKAGMPPQAIVAQEKALQKTGGPRQPVTIDGYTIEQVD